MSLNVTIPDTFNGPMDLLLHLIRRDEMDIYDIPIARLCNTYLEEIKRLDIVDVDEAAEFLDMASRLVEIKTRTLAPADPGEEDAEEEEDDFDPRSDLVEAIFVYRKFKDAAAMLSGMAEEQARRYPRVGPRPVFDDGGPTRSDVADLGLAIQKMLLRLVPADGDGGTISYREIPTTVRVEQIEAVLRDVESTRFSLLLSGRPDRAEMVGFFIAMLELIRQGRLVARQTDNYSDIVIERREPPAASAPAGNGRARLRPGRCFPAGIPGRAPVLMLHPRLCAEFLLPAPGDVSRSARRVAAARCFLALKI